MVGAETFNINIEQKSLKVECLVSFKNSFSGILALKLDTISQKLTNQMSLTSHATILRHSDWLILLCTEIVMRLARTGRH